MASDPEEQLRSLAPGAEISFSLREFPLAELLLSIHQMRFTGAIEVGEAPATERLFFRDGNMVGLLSKGDDARGTTDFARRRIFDLYDRADANVRVLEGIDRLTHFLPTQVDVRPAIAYGMVVRSSAERRRTMSERAANKTARTIVRYDEKRNSYGFPPPALDAMTMLGDGIEFGNKPCIPGLTPETTAGLLLLLDRMSLLQLE